MKKLLYLFVIALAAMLTFSCDKDKPAEEGTWMSFINGTSDIRMAMILEKGKVDYMVTAWGERYVGTYTYDATNGQLYMKFNKFYSTGSAAFPKDMSKLENFKWVEVFPYDDPDISPLTYKFTERWWHEDEGKYYEEEATKWLNLDREWTIGFVIEGNTAREPGGEGWVWERQ